MRIQSAERVFSFATTAILVSALSLPSCGGSSEEKAQLCLDEGDWDCVITESNNVLTELGGSTTPPSDTAGYASWVNAKLNLATANLGQAGFDMRKFLHAAVEIQNEKTKLDAQVVAKKITEEQASSQLQSKIFPIIKKEVFSIDSSKAEDVWVPQLNAQIAKVFSAQKHLEELLFDKGSLDGRKDTTAVDVDDTGLPKLSEYDCGQASATPATSSTTKTGTTSTTTTATTTTGTTTKKQTGTGSTGTTTTTGGKTGTTTGTGSTSSTTSSSGSKLCRTLPTGTTNQTRYLIGDSEFLFGEVLLTRTIMQAALMGLDSVLSSDDISKAITSAPLCLQYADDYVEFEPFGKSKSYTLQKSLADMSGAFSFIINSDPALSGSDIKTTFESMKQQIASAKKSAIDTPLEAVCTQIEGLAAQAETALKAASVEGATAACAKDTGNITCTLSISKSVSLGTTTQSLSAKLTLPITIGDPAKECKAELQEAFGPAGIDTFLCKEKDSGGNLAALSAVTVRVCTEGSSKDVCPTTITTKFEPETVTVLGQTKDAKSLLKDLGGVDFDSLVTKQTASFNTLVDENLAKVKTTLDGAFGSPVTRGGKLPAGVGTKVTASSATSTSTATSTTTTTGSTK